jgi:transcriptional regulator with XRE-family HTH domain
VEHGRRANRHRRRAGLTQVQLARRVGENQSFISKCERGERRIDVVELRGFCRAFGVSLRFSVRLGPRSWTGPVPCASIARAA